MKTIHKYPIYVGYEPQEIEMPDHAEILRAASQGDEFFLWALVNTDEDLVVRRFVVVATGQDLSEVSGDYLDTVDSGPFVWHVFEETAQ